MLPDVEMAHAITSAYNPAMAPSVSVRRTGRNAGVVDWAAFIEISVAPHFKKRHWLRPVARDSTSYECQSVRQFAVPCAFAALRETNLSCASSIVTGKPALSLQEQWIVFAISPTL